ncbi:NfeD family protein [Halorientalis brevis]|uniref:NfeD family protein n=1 Tax=Halorientalis brevis TaxID=1126241 RepID=A0ABD6C9P5_9EURY|nr:NfeD family protein [Halorientalis brevis]
MAEPVLGESLSLLLVVAGALLVIGEALAPGAHFIVLGVALLVAGLAGLLLPPGLGIFAPLILAALVIVVGGITLYGYRQFDFYGGKGTGQTSDSDSLRGKTGRVTERVTETSGEVKLDSGGFNPHYRARCVDGEIAEGVEVIVIDPGGGNVVTVEAIDDIEDDIDRELARESAKAADTESATERDPDADAA